MLKLISENFRQQKGICGSFTIPERLKSSDKIIFQRTDTISARKCIEPPAVERSLDDDSSAADKGKNPFSCSKVHGIFKSLKSNLHVQTI